MFGRRKRKREAATGAADVGDSGVGDSGVEVEEFVDDLDEDDRAYEDALLLKELEEREAPGPPARPQGPWDAADAPEDEVPRIDLGGLLVPVPPETEVRVDVSPEGEVVAATLVRGAASVQVNAFAAPRSEGIWPEVLTEIAEALVAGGGGAETAEGPHGPELRASVPTDAGGRIVMTPARFVGVDGPRWFLRALYTGPAAVDPAVAEPLEAAVRDVVVVRGTEPMAVRDPLPLRLPPDAQQHVDAAAQEQAAQEQAAQEQAAQEQAAQEQADPLQLAERGPEITETR